MSDTCASEIPDVGQCSECGEAIDLAGAYDPDRCWVHDGFVGVTGSCTGPLIVTATVTLARTDRLAYTAQFASLFAIPRQPRR